MFDRSAPTPARPAAAMARPAAIAMRARAACLVVLCAIASAACEPQTGGAMPTEAQVDSIYRASGSEPVSVELRGNVVQVRFRQDDDQIRRGGSLWVRVGPFIYLATPATRELFDRFDGVAGVRVVTVIGDDTEVARALLTREEATDVRMDRGAALLGRALQEGTRRPTRLEDLVQWGERYTDHRYNERFLR